MLTSNIQLGCVLTRGGGKLSRAVYIAPPHPEFQRVLIIRKFYYTTYVQLGYVLTRGGGQAVEGGLSCPTPNFSESINNTQILLHHLLQKYLVERDINFISVNLRCLLQTFSWVKYWQGVGASCLGQFILPPTQNF